MEQQRFCSDPASIMAAAPLQIDQLVDVREEKGGIVIEPVLAPIYDLDDLFAKMSSATFPEEIDFGSPAGNKVW